MLVVIGVIFIWMIIVLIASTVEPDKVEVIEHDNSAENTWMSDDLYLDDDYYNE